MIKNVLSREHFCLESESPNGQCLLQVICKKFGIVSLFNSVREEGKERQEEITGRGVSKAIVGSPTLPSFKSEVESQRVDTQTKLNQY